MESADLGQTRLISAGHGHISAVTCWVGWGMACLGWLRPHMWWLDGCWPGG